MLEQVKRYKVNCFKCYFSPLITNKIFQPCFNNLRRFKKKKIICLHYFTITQKIFLKKKTFSVNLSPLFPTAGIGISKLHFNRNYPILIQNIYHILLH